MVRRPFCISALIRVQLGVAKRARDALGAVSELTRLFFDARFGDCGPLQHGALV